MSRRIETVTDLKLHLRELKHDISCGVFDLRESQIVLRNSLDGKIVESNKVLQHAAGLVEGAEAIIFTHPVLLKEIIFEHASNFQRNLVVLS